jgi:hypothetical protein
VTTRRTAVGDLAGLLGAVVVAFALLAAPSAAAGGGIGLQLLQAPVAAGGDPRAQLYIIDHVAPGRVIQRLIRIMNSTASSHRILVYPTAATIAHGMFVGGSGHARNELSTWTTVRGGASKIPARGHRTAMVSIAVPADASPGERYGVVWAEARSGSPTGGITQVNRVGLRIYLSVGPGGPPAADFAIESLTAKRTSDGRPMVLASVRNTGGRALDMNGTLRLAGGPGGLSAGPFPASLGVTLGIGETEPVTIVLDRQLPAGPWDARVSLHSGFVARGSRASITFPAVSAAPSSSHAALFAIGAAIIALLLILGSWIAVHWNGRRRVLTVGPRT